MRPGALVIPVAGLGLALICALGWAGLDVFRKRLGAAIAPIPLLILLNLGLSPVFVAWWALAGGTISDISAYALPGGLGLALQLVANVLFLAAVRASPLSLTIPFLALTPVFATVGGALILGELPAAQQLAGVGLVVLGALILGSSGDTEGRRVRLLRVFVEERGAPMMTGVALCWGVTMILDKQALAHAAVPIHALVQLLGITAFALAYLGARGRLRELAVGREQWLTIGLASVTGALAFAFQLVAIQALLVSVLETIKRAIGLVSAVVLGKLVFREAITPAKLAAVSFMVVGVVLVMLQPQAAP